MLESIRSTDKQICLCCKGECKLIHTFDKPPKGETTLESDDLAIYKRELYRCENCGHYLNISNMPLDKLYSGQYVDATYGSNGINAAYEKVMALDPANSDNVGRVLRIVDLVKQHRPDIGSTDKKPTLLDIGSGLCVFPSAMKKAGWDCTALDPDQRASQHAKDIVKVNSVCADFMVVSALGKFDLITINKVLEHVIDPIAMLAKCAEYILPTSAIYIEVPDAEEAIKHGTGRQEFCIMHPHIFSMASLALMIDHAGFEAIRIERLHEPSGKHTLWAFLVAK